MPYPIIIGRESGPANGLILVKAAFSSMDVAAIVLAERYANTDTELSMVQHAYDVWKANRSAAKTDGE